MHVVLGRLRQCSVEVCPAESLAVTLVRYDLWPCSPNNPTVAVHFTTLQIIYAFVVGTRTSLYRCCQAFEILGDMLLDSPKVIEFWIVKWTLK